MINAPKTDVQYNTLHEAASNGDVAKYVPKLDDEFYSLKSAPNLVEGFKTALALRSDKVSYEYISKEHPITWLGYAILTWNIEIFRLLMEQKIDVLYPCVIEFDKKDPHPDWRKNGEFPLQWVVNILNKNFTSKTYSDPILQEMYHTLYEKTKAAMPAFFETIENRLSKLYRDFYSEIKAEFAKAAKEGKRLQILIGESHYQKHSYIIEAIISFIAIEYFDINALAEEKSLQRINRQIITYQGQQNGLNVAVALLWNIFLRKYRNIIPIDLGKNHGSEGWNITVEGIHHRNKVMKRELSHSFYHHIIAVIGAGHLYGIIEEQGLKNQSHIFAVNAIDLYQEEEVAEQVSGKAEVGVTTEQINDSHAYVKKWAEYLFSSAVYQPDSCLWDPEGQLFKSLVSHEDAFELVRGIHEKLKVSIMQESKQTIWNAFCKPLQVCQGYFTTFSPRPSKGNLKPSIKVAYLSDLSVSQLPSTPSEPKVKRIKLSGRTKSSNE